MAREQVIRTVSTPPPGSQQLTDLALPFAQKFAENPIPATPTNQIVPFNATQQAGMTSALGGAGAQGGVASDAANASNFFLSGAAMDPTNNAALRETINYANAPIQDNLLEQVLPQIRGEANQVGQLGGSRQGILEAAALRDAGRTMTGNAATIANQAYQSGMDARVKALGLAPSTSAVQTQPASTISAVGEAQQQQAQAELDAANAATQRDAIAPLTMAQALMGLSNAVPGGETATHTPAPKPPSDWEKALGIASMGGGVALSAIPFL